MSPSLSLCLCLSVSFSVCLSLSLSPPPPHSLFLFSSFCFFYLSFSVVPMHSLELAIVDKEQELIKAREYVSVSPPPPPPFHTLSFLPCVFLVFLSFFPSFLLSPCTHVVGTLQYILVVYIYNISQAYLPLFFLLLLLVSSSVYSGPFCYFLLHKFSPKYSVFPFLPFTSLSASMKNWKYVIHS